MSEVVLPKQAFQPKLRDFKFETIFCGFDLETWQNWLQIKKKKDKSDSDKYWLQKFREHLKTKVHYVIRVTHRASRIFHDSEIEHSNRVDRQVLIKETLKTVREKRTERRLDKKIVKNWYGANYEMIGGVFAKKSFINEIAENTNYNNPKVNKKPQQEKVNYIGIELEFNDSNKYGDEDIVVALKKEKLGKYLQVTRDGSCGHEIRVLLQEKNFEEPLRKILAVLNKMEFRTDTRCGTHVHMDMRNRNVKQVYKNLFKSQAFMRKFLTAARKRNSYCKKNEKDNFDDQLKIGDRYQGLNCQSFKQHGTLEVRMHQGTLNPDELIPWIKLLIKMVNHVDEVVAPVLSLKKAKEVFKFEPEFEEMVKGRLLMTRTKSKTRAIGA
jgi:hypothetical protein